MTDLALPEILSTLGTAIGCGALIGAEREWTRHDAGLRTNALVAAGACIFGLLSMHVFNMTGATNDPGRLAAQVVSGIGFIGAGVIIQRRARVIGLTTAATLWVAAAVGLAAGGGAEQLAWASALAVLVIQILLRVVEERLNDARADTRRPQQYRLQLRIVGRSPHHLERLIAEAQNRGSVRLITAKLGAVSGEFSDIALVVSAQKVSEIRELEAHLALAEIAVDSREALGQQTD